MLVHLFVDESLYNKKFIKYLDENFDISEHVFVFRKGRQNGQNWPESLRLKIIYASNILQFCRVVVPMLVRSQRFFIHYFSTGPMLFCWLAIAFLLPKATWIVWGDDVYWYQTRVHSLVNNIYEALRRLLLPQISQVVAVIPGDYEYLRKKYRIKARYLQAIYPLPTDFNNLEALRSDRHKPSEDVVILLGNSGCPFNYHLETIDFLTRFRNENIKIYCPLVYGGTPEYQEEVIETGRLIFGDKFFPLLQMISPEEYSRYLNEVDIAVMNHRRQQGLGNIIPLLYLGKKVFLRRETTSYLFFREIGVQVYSTTDISKMEYLEFVSQDKNIVEKNYINIKNFFSEEKIKVAWSKVLIE